MNDTELDSLLNTWKAPEVPSSMRTGLQSRFPVKPPSVFQMLRTKWLLAFAVTAGAFAAASLVQDGTLGSDSGPWHAGTQLRRTRIVHPYLAKFEWSNKPGLSTGWQWVGNKLVGSVYMFDQSTRMHYGYTWNAEPLGPRKYRFTLLPLDASVLKEKGPIAPLARPTLPRVVGVGSTFDVDLYDSGRERIYDRYELAGHPFPVEKPRGPSVITITNPRLYRNGALVLDSGGVVEASGEQIVIRLRQQGEYRVALDPHGDIGLLPVGMAKGNVIQFLAGRDDFRIVCTAPVTTNGDRDIYLSFKKDVNVESSGFSSAGAGNSSSVVPR